VKRHSEERRFTLLGESNLLPRAAQEVCRKSFHGEIIHAIVPTYVGLPPGRIRSGDAGKLAHRSVHEMGISARAGNHSVG
jgi:hypothetical protein